MDMNWQELKSVVHFVLPRMETYLGHMQRILAQGSLYNLTWGE